MHVARNARKVFRDGKCARSLVDFSSNWKTWSFDFILVPMAFAILFFLFRSPLFWLNHARQSESTHTEREWEQEKESSNCALYPSNFSFQFFHHRFAMRLMRYSNAFRSNWKFTWTRVCTAHSIFWSVLCGKMVRTAAAAIKWRILLNVTIPLSPSTISRCDCDMQDVVPGCALFWISSIGIFSLFSDAAKSVLFVVRCVRHTHT